MIETDKALALLARFRQAPPPEAPRERLPMVETQKSLDLLARLAWQPRHEQEVLEEAYRIVTQRRHAQMLAARAAARRSSC